MRILSFDIETFDFAALVCDMVGTDDLSSLRSGLPADERHSLYRNMEADPAYRALADILADPDHAAPFAELYRAFVRETIVPLYRVPIFVQARPTLRILFADAGGQPRFHRDRDYGHHDAEVNYSVALTPAFGSNAIWIESREGAGDYAPIELLPGQMVEFDGASLSHGAVVNETGRARVSFDFRVIRAADDPNRRLTAEWPREPDAHLFARVEEATVHA